MNIAEFLEARIAEDEAVANNATPREWFDVTLGRVLGEAADEDAYPPEVTGHVNRSDADHITRWDPARVLAECAAKRAIVAEHELVPQTYATSKNWDGPDVGCSICAEWDGLICGEGPCDTLRHLAAVYDQHPDYDPAWRIA